MRRPNIEIKARCAGHPPLHDRLRRRNADFPGEDHLIDPSFRVPNGRLKLREGYIGEKQLRQQCRHYMNCLVIGKDNLIEVSFSDLIIAGNP